MLDDPATVRGTSLVPQLGLGLAGGITLSMVKDVWGVSPE